MNHVEDALVDGGYTLPLLTASLLDWVSIFRVSKGGDSKTDVSGQFMTRTHTEYPTITLISLQ